MACFQIKWVYKPAVEKLSIKTHTSFHQCVRCRATKRRRGCRVPRNPDPPAPHPSRPCNSICVTYAGLYKKICSVKVKMYNIKIEGLLTLISVFYASCGSGQVRYYLVREIFDIRGKNNKEETINEYLTSNGAMSYKGKRGLVFVFYKGNDY